MATAETAYDLRFMLRAALRGFAGARERLRTRAAPGVLPEVVFVPLAEALWWAVSPGDGFDELASEGTGWANRGAYRDARKTDTSGRVLIGVRYARDRCGHQLAMAALEDGLRPPFSFPNTPGVSFRWRPSGQLPQPAGERRLEQSERIRPDYDMWLVGRPSADARVRQVKITVSPPALSAWHSRLGLVAR
jgi:hypothetical protein